MSTITKQEMTLASKVAYSISRNWKLVEADDVEAHLFLWLVENERYLINWRKEEGDGKLFVSLRREAAKYCASETKHKASIDNLQNNNVYNIDMIYRTLPFIFEYNPLEHDISNTGDSLAYEIISDISNAYHSLNKKDKHIIDLRFKNGLSYKEIAEYYDVKENTANQRIHRTVEKLYEKLSSTIVTTPKVILEEKPNWLYE